MLLNKSTNSFLIKKIKFFILVKFIIILSVAGLEINFK
jgi:hypothetical protein